MLKQDTLNTIQRKLKPFVYSFVAIVVLLFVQFLFYSVESIFAYTVGILLTYQLLRYGNTQNKKVNQRVSHRQQWGAFLLGCFILLCAIIATTLWTGNSPILHAYRFTPIAHMIYIICLAPIGEEVIYRQMLYKDAFAHKWIGRVVSGTLFIAIHTPTTLPSLTFYIIATIGLFVAYEKSGNNLWVAIAVHSLNNAMAFI